MYPFSKESRELTKKWNNWDDKQLDAFLEKADKVWGKELHGSKDVCAAVGCSNPPKPQRVLVLKKNATWLFPSRIAHPGEKRQIETWFFCKTHCRPSLLTAIQLWWKIRRGKLTLADGLTMAKLKGR